MRCKEIRGDTVRYCRDTSRYRKKTVRTRARVAARGAGTVCGEVGRVLRFPQLSHGPHPLSVHQCEWPMCRVATVYTCGAAAGSRSAQARQGGEREMAQTRS